MFYTKENSSSYILFPIELLFLSFCFVTSTIFGYILWKTKTFHRNIRVLFMSVIISTYGYAIARYYYIANDYSWGYLSQNLPNLTYMETFCETLFGLFFSIVQLGVATERIIATIYATSYEKHGYFSTFLVIIIPWSVNAIVRYLQFVNIITLTNISFVMLFTNIVTWTISENIRVVRILLIFVGITAIRNTLSITMLLIIGYYSDPNKLYHLSIILNHVWRINIAFHIFIYPIPLIFAHKDLKKRIRENVFCLNSKNEATKIVLPKNALGEKIIMGNSGDDYFKNLLTEWNKFKDINRQRIYVKKFISNRIGFKNL